MDPRKYFEVCLAPQWRREDRLSKRIITDSLSYRMCFVLRILPFVCSSWPPIRMAFSLVGFRLCSLVQPYFSE